MCAAGVNNSNVGLHKHFLACTSVSICCGFHGDFHSSACVQADRTWPVSSAGVRGQVLLFLQTLNLPLFHQVPVKSELNLCLSIQLIRTHSVRVMLELWGLLTE